jgi:hypothetical protein
MKTPEDPLSQLVAEEGESENAIIRTLLADLLIPYVKITSSSELLLLPDFYSRSPEDKVLIFLLGAKARSLLRQEAEDGARPREIIERNLMPVGSAKTAIKSLLEKRHLILKNGDGRYTVPTHVLARIKDRLVN